MKVVSCHTADSKPVKQEVNSTVILPTLVFSGETNIRNPFEKQLKIWHVSISHKNKIKQYKRQNKLVCFYSVT